MSIASPVPRRELSPAVQLVRLAEGQADMMIVRELDNAVFSPANHDQQRARPGELEDGVAAGDVYLLERDGEPVAYLHMDRQVPDRVYVAGLAVRPDLQGGGLGKRMIDHFLLAMGDQRAHTAVVTVTSPRNLVMLSLLFARGFAGRWLLRDFFGPGRDRLGCQLRTTWPPIEGTVQLTPSSQLDTVYGLMERHQHVVRALIQTDDGLHFLSSPVQTDEFLDCLPPD